MTCRSTARASLEEISKPIAVARITSLLEAAALSANARIAGMT
jgi:hypothetical protein